MNPTIKLPFVIERQVQHLDYYVDDQPMYLFKRRVFVDGNGLPRDRAVTIVKPQDLDQGFTSAYFFDSQHRWSIFTMHWPIVSWATVVGRE